MSNIGKVDSLWRYPIKSMRGRAHRLERAGLGQPPNKRLKLPGARK